MSGQIYYTRSLDGGEVWEKNYIIIKEANSARCPVISCRGNNVYLVWQDVENKIFFKASGDLGRTWGNETFLGKADKPSSDCSPPALSASDNEVTVAWADLRDDKRGFRVSAYGLSLFKTNKDKMISFVACRKSAANGRIWSKEQILTVTKLSKDMSDEIDNPVMLSDGSLSYLFWLDKRAVPTGEIFYTRYDPAAQKDTISGKNLYPAEKATPKCPSVVFDKKGNLHFAWASNFGGESTVSYGAIDPRGNILKEKKDLATTSGRFNSPKIINTPSGLMYVFWSDEPKDKAKKSRVFLKASKDDGVTWEDWAP
jgi:hypothetical protein